MNAKCIISLFIFIVTSYVQYKSFVDIGKLFGISNNNYENVGKFFIYTINSSIVSVFFNPFTWVWIKKLIHYKCNMNFWKLTHIENNNLFASKLQKKMFDERNKYIVKCFDELHARIINPISCEQRLKAVGGCSPITINCSLIYAIDNISNGVNFNEDIYLIFLKATASACPKEVVGIWDLTLKADIPEIEKLTDLEKEIMYEYAKMYASLSNSKSKERYFLYKDKDIQDLLTVNKIKDKKLENLVAYMNNSWGITKFYFISKTASDGLLDGLILDGQFYLSYSKNENGTDSKVSFSTFPSSLRGTIDRLKTGRRNKLEGYTSFDIFY